MAISKAGNFLEDFADGTATFGLNALGSLTINGGSTYTLDDPTNTYDDTFLGLGQSAGGNGTATVTGAGSKLVLNGSGHLGPVLQVANYGIGTLNVTDGGSIILNETTDSGDTFSILQVARRSGTGTMTVDAGTVSLTGPAASLQIGREGGTGQVDILNGSHLNLTSTVTSVDYGAIIQVGRQGGNGTLSVDASTVSSTGPNALIQIGRDDGSTGRMEIRDGGNLDMTATGVGIDYGATVQVGRQGGDGTLIVDAGAASLTSVNADLQIGREEGAGHVEIRNGSHVNLTSTGVGDDYGASIQVGRQGGTGTLIVDNSTVETHAADTYSGFGIGVSGQGAGTGEVTLQNGAMMSFEGGGVWSNVGSMEGASATLRVLSGSKLILNADDDSGGMSIGESTGVVHASVEVDGAGSVLDVQGWLGIGTNGYDANPDGNGTLTITGGGKVIAGDSNVGHGGTLYAGDGTMVMQNNLDVIDGALVLLSGGDFELTHGLAVDSQGILQFQVAADGAAAGHLTVSGDDLFLGADARVIIDPLGGYKFASGQSFEIIGLGTGAALNTHDDFDYGNISVTGQAGGFGYAIGRTGGGVAFQALNKGDGSGTAAFHFGDDSTSGADYTYDSDAGAGDGDGFGGTYDSVILRNADEIYGTAAADTLRVTGATGGVKLLGLGGDDELYGSDGNDTLDGGAGFDTLIGGGGDDVLDGGVNSDNQGDIMLGGAGDDTYYVDSPLDLVDEGFIFPDAGWGGTDTVVSTANWYWDSQSVGEIDRIAEDAADPTGAGVTFVGGIFDNVLYGHSGTDILFGRGGNDVYRAGDGVDWISLSTLGLTDDNAYTGVDGHNTVIVDPRASGGFSYDILFDFDPAKDKVDVSSYQSGGVHQYASGADVLARAVDDGAGSSYIALGDGLDYLYFVGLTKAELNAGDFVV